MQNPAVSTVIRCLAPTTLIMLSVLIGGCNYIVPLAYITAPEAKVEPVYVLNDVPTVIFLDDRENVINPISLRRVVVDKITEDLLKHKTLTTMISPRDATAVALQSDTVDDLMPIGEIGRAVGAEQVVYVLVESFVPTVDGITPRAGAVAYVKVIDVANEARLFPTGEDGSTLHRVQSLTGELPNDLYQSRGQRMQILETLATELGDDIAKLFFQHKPDDALGSNLNPR